MVYAIKLLLVVLLVGATAAWVLRGAFANLLSQAQYKRAWMCVLAVTLPTFLSFRPDLFCVAVAIVSVIAAGHLGEGDRGNVNAFLLFLLVLPPLNYTLGGLEGLNYVLRLDPMRLLSLALLTVPAVRLLFRRRQRDEPAVRVVDLVMVAYQVWGIFLVARYANLTGIARTIVESFCDVLIPYYVITRTLRTAADLRTAGTYLAIGCVVMGSVACAESLIQHNVYAGLQWIYGVRWESTVDLMRGGFLRVESATSQPIVLAFVLIFAISLWTWLRGDALRNRAVILTYLMFAFALLSTWSRGPWLGTALLLFALVLQRWLSPRAFGVVVLLGLGAAVFAKMGGADETVMAGLQALFGNSHDDLSTINYRRELLDASLALIQQSPWWGVPNYDTALETFRQGEGMIDLVNTYIVILLNTGVPGLAMFLFPYAYVIARMLGVQRRANLVSPSSTVLGKFPPAFIAMILAMLFTIFTTSTYGVMKYLLMLAIALPVAWLKQARLAAAVEDIGIEDPAPEPWAPARLPGRRVWRG